MADAVERIHFAKSLNAGQICVAPVTSLIATRKSRRVHHSYKQYFKRFIKPVLKAKKRLNLGDRVANTIAWKL